MRLTAGLVGYGRWARAIHVPALRHNGVRLLGIADVNEGALAAAPKCVSTFKDYRDLLDIKPDLAVICAPDKIHAEICIEAIKRGINVLTEKPVATSTREASGIKEAGTGSQLCVMHQYKFFEPFLKLRSVISRHELGEITSAKIFFAHGRPHDWWHGVIPEDFPVHVMHPFYLLEWIFGRPTEVTGIRDGHSFYGQFATRSGPIQVDICQFPGEGKHLFKVDVTGTNCSIEAADPPCVWWLGHNVRSVIRLSAKSYVDQTKRLLRLLSTYPLQSQVQFALGTCDLVVKRFLKSIETETEPPVTLREAFNALRYAEAYTKACTDGIEVRL
jgi:predicted dehydrogenase